MTTPELRARWRQCIEDLTYSDAEAAEWCVELMAEADALGRVRSLVESWPHGDNGQDYRAAVTQCRAAVLTALDADDHREELMTREPDIAAEIAEAESIARRQHDAGTCHESEWSCSSCESESESEGWASYDAEQERHAETMAARNAHFEARNKMAAKVERLEERLADMTREARLSREATERAVQRLERLRNEVARLHDVYAAAPNEPRCCSDCAANDISNELRAALRGTADPHGGVA